MIRFASILAALTLAQLSASISGLGGLLAESFPEVSPTRLVQFLRGNPGCRLDFGIADLEVHFCGSQGADVHDYCYGLSDNTKLQGYKQSVVCEGPEVLVERTSDIAQDEDFSLPEFAFKASFPDLIKKLEKSGDSIAEELDKRIRRYQTSWLEFDRQVKELQRLRSHSQTYSEVSIRKIEGKRVESERRLRSAQYSLRSLALEFGIIDWPPEKRDKLNPQESELLELVEKALLETDPAVFGLQATTLTNEVAQKYKVVDRGFFYPDHHGVTGPLQAYYFKLSDVLTAAILESQNTQQPNSAYYFRQVGSYRAHDEAWVDIKDEGHVIAHCLMQSAARLVPSGVSDFKSILNFPLEGE